VFIWREFVGATSYRIEVASDPLFVTLVAADSGLTDTCHTLGVPLEKGRTYFWRVSAAIAGGVTPYSRVGSFETVFPPPAIVRMKVMLEGPYDGRTRAMKTALGSAGILADHFPGSAIPARAVDSICVGTRPVENPTTSPEWNQPAWLLADGFIRNFTDTTKDYVEFPPARSAIRLVVRHRNHLVVMSADSITLTPDMTINYDWTTSQNKAYGKQAMKEIAPGVYGLYGGDANASGIITTSDANGVYGMLNAVGYDSNDTNLSGVITAADANLVFSNLNVSSQVSRANGDPRGNRLAGDTAGRTAH
jgi:hypothetical protein